MRRSRQKEVSLHAVFASPLPAAASHHNDGGCFHPFHRLSLLLLIVPACCSAGSFISVHGTTTRQHIPLPADCCSGETACIVS